MMDSVEELIDAAEEYKRAKPVGVSTPSDRSHREWRAKARLDDAIRQLREIDALPNHPGPKRRILAAGHSAQEHVEAYQAGQQPFLSLYRIHPDHTADEDEIPVLLVRRCDTHDSGADSQALRQALRRIRRIGDNAHDAAKAYYEVQRIVERTLTDLDEATP